MTHHFKPGPFMKIIAACVALSLSAGCASNGQLSNPFTDTSKSTSPGPQPKSSSPDWTAVATGVCMLVATTGGFDKIVDRLIEPQKRRGASRAQLEKLRRGYAMTLGLAGCVGIPYFANSVYAKLSDDGKKNRERALNEAASSGRPQQYRDPVSGLTGSVKVIETFDVAGTNDECRTQEDTATHSTDRESVLITWCRTKPNGDWWEKKPTVLG